MRRFDAPARDARALALTLATAILASTTTASAAVRRPGVLLLPPGAKSSGSVTVDASQTGATIVQNVRGANMAVWFNITQAGIAKEFEAAGLRMVRWPGGSESDQYHWQTNTSCNGGYQDPNSTFDNFMQDVALPAHLETSLTVNYGSNEACNGGGDPAEAAAWVDYANNTKKYGVKWWTVGNENYGSWEYDLHPAPHDPTTYANAVATGYYPQMKAKDAKAQVGVVVDGSSSWDQIVLQQAKYDFVEFHYYAQTPGQESDTYLVQQAAPALAQAVSSLRGEMTQYGVPASVPIYLGELGSVYANPGKQTSSITQALFAGQAIADLMSLGVPRATWWLGNGGCSDASSGNFSPTLYGWQTFGGYMIFSDGLPEYGCSNAPPLALGVLLPTARAYQVLAKFGSNGGTMLGASVGGSLPLVRAYGATRGKGYSVLLFNLDQNVPASVSVAVAHAAGQSYSAVATTYDRKRYDASKNNVWLGPQTHSLGTVSPTFTVSAPPWSIVNVNLTPA
jgi:hypothetical protein